MKVAFASYDSAHDVSGVSTWLRRLLPRLHARGVAVEAHLLGFDGAPGANTLWFEAHGVPVRWAPWPRETTEAARACLQFVATSPPDVYVSNCILPSYIAAAHLRAAGLPTIGVLHADDAFYESVVDAFVRTPARPGLSALVPVSAFLESKVQPLAAARGLSVRRIGCGVPLTDAAASAATDRFRLIYVGRLEEEQKRISDLTHALCAAARQNPALDAWIVGEGRARADVERIIAAESPAVGRVRLLGRLDNDAIYDVLRQSHALVLLSDYEGLPVSVLEAMSVGVVPICLDLRSGIREAISPGVNGLIVTDRDADFLAAVRSLSADPILWARLSAAARQTVAREFSIEACADRWHELLTAQAASAPRDFRFQVPRRVTLPPPDLRFGSNDVRTPLARRLWSATRMYLGARRRLLLPRPPSSS